MSETEMGMNRYLVVGLTEARKQEEEIERAMTLIVRDYEAKTGCVVTKVSLEWFEDIKFVRTVTVLGRRTREERKADGSIPKQGAD